MREIPKEILERLELEIKDEITYVKSIRPVDPCPCGAVLEKTRVVRIARNTEPTQHFRENCGICKRVSILDANDWKTAMELNREMRTADFIKNNPDLYKWTK